MLKPADFSVLQVANTLWAWAAIRYREAPALSSMAALAVRRGGPWLNCQVVVGQNLGTVVNHRR